MPVVNLEHLVLVQISVHSANKTLAERLAHLPVPEEGFLAPVAQLRPLAVLQRHPADLVGAARQGASLVVIMHRSRQVAFSAAQLLPLLNRVEAFLAQVTNRRLALQPLPLALAPATPTLADYLVVLNNRRRNPVSLSAVVQAQVTHFNRVEPTLRTIPLVVCLVVKPILHSGVVNNSNRRQRPTLLAPLEAIKIKLKLAPLRSVALGLPTSKRKSRDFLARHLVRVMQGVCSVVITNKTINSSQRQEGYLAVVRVISLVAVRYSVRNLLRPALGCLVQTLRTLQVLWGVPACSEALHSPTIIITRTSRIKAVDFSAATASCNNQSLAVYLDPPERRLVAIYSTTIPNRHPVDHYLEA